MPIQKPKGEVTQAELDAIQAQINAIIEHRKKQIGDLIFRYKNIPADFRKPIHAGGCIYLMTKYNELVNDKFSLAKFDYELNGYHWNQFIGEFTRELQQIESEYSEKIKPKGDLMLDTKKKLLAKLKDMEETWDQAKEPKDFE